MGICSSCLGRNRSREIVDEDDSSRLLFDDAHPNHYGSFGDQNAITIQQDPQEVQRENEALQRVVTQTSNSLVDIYALVSQNPAPPASTNIYSPQDTLSMRYKTVLSKVSLHDQLNTPLTHESTPRLSGSWASEETEETMANIPIRSQSEPLLAGFSDAESAMK